MTECLCNLHKCLMDGSHECDKVGTLNKLGFPKEYCCACWKKYFCPDFTQDKWCKTCFLRTLDLDLELIFADPTSLTSPGSAIDGSNWFEKT